MGPFIEYIIYKIFFVMFSKENITLLCNSIFAQWTTLNTPGVNQLQKDMVRSTLPRFSVWRALRATKIFQRKCIFDH